MKASIESTSKIVEFTNGVKARVWEGVTEKGVPFHAFIVLVAVAVRPGGAEDFEQFYAELGEHKLPTALTEAIPARMIM